MSGYSIRIELDTSGIAELLCSAAIGEECERAAQAIADRAGEGFEVSGPWRAGFGGGRVAYSVKTATQEARLAESQEQALSRAVHG
jgi:hypothetical protein